MIAVPCVHASACCAASHSFSQNAQAWVGGTPSKGVGVSRYQTPRKFAGLQNKVWLLRCLRRWPEGPARPEWSQGLVRVVDHANVMKLGVDFQMWRLALCSVPWDDTGQWLSRMAGSNRKGAPLVVDLGFDITPGPGRKAQALHAEVVRELTQADLALLATERAIKPTALQRITDRHHALARCLATGMSATEASLITGYTPSRISILRGDPAFEELMAHYKDLEAEETFDYQRKAAIIRNMASDLVMEKLSAELERDPTVDPNEKVSLGAALDTAKQYMDRTGFGPQSKTTNVNVNVNLGDRMKAARERVTAAALPHSAVASGRAEASHEASLAPTIIEGDFTEVKK